MSLWDGFSHQKKIHIQVRHAKGSRETNQLKEWMREEKTISVPPSKGVISNFGFFSKHLFTDLVRISSICIHIKKI